LVGAELNSEIKADPHAGYQATLSLSFERDKLLFQ
jgi:hypothetical protein